MEIIGQDPTVYVGIVGGLLVTIYLIYSGSTTSTWLNKNSIPEIRNSIYVNSVGDMIYTNSELIQRILPFYQCGKVSVIEKKSTKERRGRMFWQLYSFQKKHDSEENKSSSSDHHHDRDEIILTPAIEIPCDASNQEGLLQQLNHLPEFDLDFVHKTLQNAKEDFKKITNTTNNNLSEEFVCWDIRDL